MSYIPFDNLPDSSRLWIFAATRRLTDAEADMLRAEMQAFCNSWLAHGAAVTGSAELRYNQFLLVAADEATFPTGCSTDEMMRRVRMLSETYDAGFFGMPKVQYRSGGQVVSVGRNDFAELVTNGEAAPDTIVFDNTLTSLADLRKGKWEIAAKESWHARAFEFQN